VLGAGVVFFGGSLFQTNDQQDSIQASNANLWFNSTAQGGSTYSEAAFLVQTPGSKITTIPFISVRGIQIPQSSWYFNTAQADASNTQAALNFATCLYLPSQNPSSASINLKSGLATFTQANGSLSPKPGQAAIIYLYNPASLTAMDIGNSFTMNVQSWKAVALQSITAQGIQSTQGSSSSNTVSLSDALTVTESLTGQASGWCCKDSIDFARQRTLIL